MHTHRTAPADAPAEQRSLDDQEIRAWSKVGAGLMDALSELEADHPKRRVFHGMYSQVSIATSEYRARLGATR